MICSFKARRIRFAVGLFIFSSTLMAQTASKLAQEVPKDAASMIAGMKYQTPITASGAGQQELWSHGDRFMASFHHGFAFYSRDASRRGLHLLTWKTVAITAGGKPVTERFGLGTKHQKWRCVYTHGAGITERYDLSRAGVEQSFLLTQRPKTAGDLCIVGQVDTDLQADSVTEQHADLIFVDGEGDAVTSYGKATAFDAEGASHNVTTSWDGKRLTLRVDGAWLAKAKYPVLVDPLVGSRVIMNLESVERTSLRQLAMGHETFSKHHNTMIAYAFTSRLPGDPKPHQEVNVVLCNRNFTNPVVVRTFVWGHASFPIWHDAVAPVHGARRWVLAVSEPAQVYVHDFGNTNYSSGLVVSMPLPRDHGVMWPGVGGTAALARDKHGTAGSRTLTAGTRALVAGTLCQFVGPLEAIHWPAVAVLDAKSRAFVGGFSKLGSEKTSWPVTIQHINDGSNRSPWVVLWHDWKSSHMRGAMVYPNQSTSSVATFAPRTFPITQAPCAVAGGGGRYMLAYGRPLPSDQGVGLYFSKELAVQRFDWPHGASLPSIQPSRAVVSYFQSLSHVLYDIAFDATSKSHWAILGASKNRLFSLSSGFALRLNEDGSVHERQSLWSDLKAWWITGNICFDPTSQCFPIAFASSPKNSSSPWTLRGTHFCYHVAVSPVRFGFGKGAISTSGKSVAGSDFFTIKLNQAAANQRATLMVGTRRINQSMAGAGMKGSYLYVGDVRNTYSVRTNIRGEASVRIPLPKNTRQTLYAQWTFDDPRARTPVKRATSPGLHIVVR